MNFIYVTEPAWDVWVFAEHMSKGDGRDNLFFEPDHVCSPTLALNYTCGSCMGVLRVTAVRCFPDLCRELELRSWALTGCRTRTAVPDEHRLLFQDVLLGLLQGAATSLQNVVHLQSQACPLLLSHQVKAPDSMRRIKLCLVLGNSQ